MKRLGILLITVALIVGMVACEEQSATSPKIRDWYDLDAVRDNLGGSYSLMNDLDSATAGYEELASSTANEGKGWQPIVTLTVESGPEGLRGSFDGQGYEIRDLFINRPDEDWVGLFGALDRRGVIKDIGIIKVTVIGKFSVGGLVGKNDGTVRNSYFTGSVTGNNHVGGLMGQNYEGIVSNSYSTGSVTGYEYVGGLVGKNDGTVDNSYSTGSVTGNNHVGGLMGQNYEGIVDNSYSTGSVTGNAYVGGLVGLNCYSNGIVNNSYSIGSVTGTLRVGGLMGENYKGIVSNSYSTGGVTGTLRVGGLMGQNYEGTVNNSYSTGNVTGDAYVGGLVGQNDGTVDSSYSIGNVTGGDFVGGLVGANNGGVSSSFWDTQTSGQATSDGGTGNTTAEMQDITTFPVATWDIITVASPGTRNPYYIWNIVDRQTYPFLSWQPI